MKTITFLTDTDFNEMSERFPLCDRDMLELTIELYEDEYDLLTPEIVLKLREMKATVREDDDEPIVFEPIESDWDDDNTEEYEIL